MSEGVFVNQVFDDSAPSGLPDGFYIGLLSSPIVQGKVTVAVVFDNNTDAKVSVSWANSHLYKVTVTDVTGATFDLEQLLPPPNPTSLPRMSMHGRSAA